jgi:hypothetical protein
MLQHHAPVVSRNTVPLTALLPSEVPLRRFQGSMSPASFPPKAPTIRRPLPSTGPLRVGSPASSVLWSAPTPCHPSPQTSSPSPSDTASAPAYLLPSPEGCFPGRASGRDYRLSHSGFHSAEVTGPPRFLEDPNACMPCSSTPAEPCHSCCIMPGCCLPQVTQRRLPQRFFRGSITRPTDPLCTLRSLGCPRTTQHSVPAASTLCRVGLIAYRVPQRSFYFLLEASPPSRLCLAHITQIKRLPGPVPISCPCFSTDAPLGRWWGRTPHLLIERRGVS